MTERARNIIIAVVLAALAALLTGLYVTNYQKSVRTGEEHVTVFVAKRDIPSGTSGADAIAKGMIGEETVVRRGVVPGAIASRNQISSLVASQQIFEGEQITMRRFSQSGTEGIHGELKGTMRGYQVHGDPNQLLAGTLRKGDHVDLLATFQYKTEGQNYFATRTVLRNIVVLRPPETQGASSDVTNEFSGGSNVILGLTDAQAQKLDFTINVAVHRSEEEPRWHLTLRSPLKSDDSPESLTNHDSILMDGLSAQQRARLQGKYGGN